MRSQITSGCTIGRIHIRFQSLEKMGVYLTPSMAMIEDLEIQLFRIQHTPLRWIIRTVDNVEETARETRPNQT
jgi:hypothetical protein